MFLLACISSVERLQMSPVKHKRTRTNHRSYIPIRSMGLTKEIKKTKVIIPPTIV